MKWTDPIRDFAKNFNAQPAKRARGEHEKQRLRRFVLSEPALKPGFDVPLAVRLIVAALVFSAALVFHPSKTWYVFLLALSALLAGYDLAIDSILEAAVCKNLFLCNRQHTEFYLLMMPGEKPFRTKELSSQLGCSRLSFAGPEEMEKYLDITPGSVSVLGLMNDTGHAVRLLVDRDVLEEEFVGCHPCINTSSLKLRGKDLFGPVLRCMDHELTPVTLTGEP